MMDHKWIYAVIGERVRQRRKSFKMKQEALAELVGISRASLANIETGRQGVLVHHLYALGEALELDPQALMPDLIDRPNEEPGVEAVADTALPLPSGLKRQHAEQISRVFALAPDSKQKNEGSHGKKTKR
jgi:transcriptional regulator with XRE-family HTH domain